MHEANEITAQSALQRLAKGNCIYLDASANPGDISPAARKKGEEQGQHPCAIVVTCSDSRVIPEAIFSAGIGELFVIRIAGNVIDDHQLGSIEYAAGHLDVKLVVVLGHTKCGAIAATISGNPGGYIKYIAKEIKTAIGDEKDDYKACCLNVKHGIWQIMQSQEIQKLVEEKGLQVVGAVYHIDSEKVGFLR